MSGLITTKMDTSFPNVFRQDSPLNYHFFKVWEWSEKCETILYNHLGDP